MRKRKPVPERQGEPLEEYIARLIAADQQRIRIHSDYVDPKGNVIVRPVLMFGRDPNDDIRPAKMDTQGRLDVTGVCPEHQADAFLNQANPVSGTRYEVIPETECVRIYTMTTKVNWTVQPSPIEIHMTIDGVAHRHFLSNPVTNTNYWAKRFESNTADEQTLRAGDFQAIIAFLIEGRSVKVEAEITGGTVSNLNCRVKWAKW